MACAYNWFVVSQAAACTAAPAPNPEEPPTQKCTEKKATGAKRTGARTGAKAGAKKVKVHLTLVNGMYCHRCLVLAMYKPYIYSYAELWECHQPVEC